MQDRRSLAKERLERLKGCCWPLKQLDECLSDIVNMRQSYLILINTAVIWVNRVLLLVPQLVLVPYLIGKIGENGYGIYALIWSLMIGIDRLEQSLQQGVVKYSAALLAENRLNEVNRIVSSSFVYSIILAFLASTCIFVGALLSVPKSELETALFVLVALTLLIIPLTPYIAVLQALQYYFVGVFADTISKYISLAAILVWFKLATPSAGAAIIIMASMLLLSRISQVPLAYRFVPGLQNRPSLFNRDAFILIFAFGGMTVFIALCGIANSTGVRWLMGLLVSTSFVAHLAIMVMPSSLISQIVLAMTITIMPATSAYEATGNIVRLRELLIRTMRYTAIVVLVPLLFAMLLVKEVLALWVGPDYIFLAPYTMGIFVSMVFLLASSSAHHMLKGLGRLRITVVIALLGKVIIPIGLLLGVLFVSHDPYIAVTSGLAVGNVVSGVLTVCFSIKVVQAGFFKTLWRAFFEPSIAMTFVAAPVFLLIHYAGIDSPCMRLCIATIGALVFLIEMYFVFATSAERRQAAELVRSFARYITRVARRASKVKSMQL